MKDNKLRISYNKTKDELIVKSTISEHYTGEEKKKYLDSLMARETELSGFLNQLKTNADNLRKERTKIRRYINRIIRKIPKEFNETSQGS